MKILVTGAAGMIGSYLTRALVASGYEVVGVDRKGNLAVPPFYFYRAADAARIPEALESGCNADAPGSFAAWLSHQTAVHAWVMPGKRYDIGDVESYEAVKKVFE